MTIRFDLKQSGAFGPVKWLDDERWLETPVGEPCMHCHEPIAECDFGIQLPVIDVGGLTFRACHRECELRRVVGSVGHQSQTCSCFGGTEEDPPGMTKREAAKAAVALWRKSQRKSRDD